MWVAASDLKKAFDSMQHAAIWRSFRNHSVSEQYICFLQKLYTDQRATVLTDVESDKFGIARGTTWRPFEQSPVQLGSPMNNGERH